MRRWVLITRHHLEAHPLGQALQARGIDLVGYPVLHEVPAADENGWQRAAACRARITSLLFTSPRAPRHFRQAAKWASLWPVLALLPTDAVGRATAHACHEIGLYVRHVGDSTGVTLVGEFAGGWRPGDVVLHPTGRHHRKETHEALAAAGADVLPVVVYDMEESPPETLPRLPDTPPVAVLLTSPRAAAVYLRRAPPWVCEAPHFALGATTAEAAARLGLVSRILAHPDPLLLMEELCLT